MCNSNNNNYNNNNRRWQCAATAMTLSSPTSSNLQFSMACVWLAAIRDGVVIIGVVLRYSPRHSSSAIMHSSRVSASSVATCI